MRRLRVLLMVDRAGAPGGAERFVTGLAAHLPRDRIEPWVCSTRRGGEGVGTLVEAGIPHIELGRHAKWDVHRLLKLGVLLRRERFDILHAHKFGSNVWGTLIGRACRVPVIIAHEHNWAYSGNRLRLLLDGRVVGRLATRFIAVSKTGRDRMIALEGVPAAKLEVLPTAYIPHAADGDIRAELGIAPEVPVIAVAAGLRTEKALDVMLEAHALVCSRIGDVHLVIAGSGPCRQQLEHQAERLALGGRVHFLGTRRDIDALLKAADVGAMSSDWEGLPLFVFECMAARTPLVATSVGGIPEVVRDGTTALLVPPRSPASLSEALQRLLTDRALAERLATAAAERFDEFTIESVAARFARLYEELAQGSDRAS